MKFKDELALLNYLTLPENYGEISVSTYIDAMGYVIDFSFENDEKTLPSNASDMVQFIIETQFTKSSNYGITYEKGNRTQFSIVNNNGNLEISFLDDFFNSHVYEEEEIKEQLKDLLDGILFEDYSISLNIIGYYDKNIPVKIVEFSVGRINENGNEVDFDDIGDKYKNKVLTALLEWAISFSAKSSNYEYSYTSFGIEINAVGKPNYDEVFIFFEESNSNSLKVVELEMHDGIDRVNMNLEFNFES